METEHWRRIAQFSCGATDRQAILHNEILLCGETEKLLFEVWHDFRLISVNKVYSQYCYFMAP